MPVEQMKYIEDCETTTFDKLKKGERFIAKKWAFMTGLKHNESNYVADGSATIQWVGKDLTFEVIKL